MSNPSDLQERLLEILDDYLITNTKELTKGSTKHLLRRLETLVAQANREAVKNFVMEITGLLPAFPPKSMDEQAVETLLGKLLKYKIEQLNQLDGEKS